MKANAIIFLVCAFTPVSIFAMWPFSPQEQIDDLFDTYEAQTHSIDYNWLSDYLRKFVDQTPPSGNTDWHSRRKLKSYEYIERHGLDHGNVVCLYFFVRNCLKYGTFSLTTEQEIIDLFWCIMAMLLCLQNVAYDIVYYQTHNEADTTVFNTYTILKKKFHYLLTTFIPNLEDALDGCDYLSFSNVCRTSINHRNENQWHINRHPYSWVKVFGWSHAWTPRSKGIYFGKESKIFLAKKNEEISEVALSSFATLLCSFPVEAPFTFHHTKISSWKEFFRSFDFPISQEKINRLPKSSNIF